MPNDVRPEIRAALLGASGAGREVLKEERQASHASATEAPPTWRPRPDLNPARVADLLGATNEGRELLAEARENLRAATQTQTPKPPTPAPPGVSSTPATPAPGKDTSRFSKPGDTVYGPSYPMDRGGR